MGRSKMVGHLESRDGYGKTVITITCVRAHHNKNCEGKFVNFVTQLSKIAEM